MNHALRLRLDQTTAKLPGFRFALQMQNQSKVKLYLPYPDITGLRFFKPDCEQFADWGTHLFVSAAGGGLTLCPGEQREFDFQVRPAHVKPQEEDSAIDFDYERWGVDLSEGVRSVQYTFEVTQGYFDPDSHWEMEQLEARAQIEQASVWLGEANSNQLRPFLTPVPPLRLPVVVKELAQAIRNGIGNPLILADALEESGHLELADHFRGEAWHPKGCWALDTIIGKS